MMLNKTPCSLCRRQ